MKIQDYVSIFYFNRFPMGKSKKSSGPFQCFLCDLSPSIFVNTNSDEYILGDIKVLEKKTVLVRSYVGSKGPCVELVCNGSFDAYPFWLKEDVENEAVQKLKSRFPGSSHVHLSGPIKRIESNLEELISDLKAFELHSKKFRK